jgi:hypothetical protein
MIINIDPHHFGGPMRNGDIIASLNFCEFLRKKDNQEYKFYIPNESIQSSEYCIKFRDWLTENTDYISKEPGEKSLSISNINLWDFRSITGDVLNLDFKKETKNKICIFPLFDGPYNTYRNWSVEMTNDFIEVYSDPAYDDYEKYICINAEKEGLVLKNFKYSTDFIENVNHITDCSHYVGGDTGMSHFASVINRQRFKRNYYYGSVGLLHTTPFYALQGRGCINLFWNNYWRTDLL